jgi:hypothetical protein
LIALNCDKVQGYLFCRPLAPRDIMDLLAPRPSGPIVRTTIYSGSTSFDTFKSAESAA